MKLYYGGFADYKEFVVADSEEQAIFKVGIKVNAPFLPITVEEITEVDGFKIQVVSDVLIGIHQGNDPVGEIGTPGVIPSTLRHCKQCDFTCENQGQLLAHYRDAHPKGD